MGMRMRGVYIKRTAPSPYDCPHGVVSSSSSESYGELQLGRSNGTIVVYKVPGFALFQCGFVGAGVDAHLI